MDWSSCVICGSYKEEPLKCPVDILQKDCYLNIFSVFLENVNEFKELNSLPVNVNFGPEVSPELFVRSRASWHKSCHLKFSTSKLERVKNKRKNCTAGEEQRRLVKRKTLSNELCVFCEQDGGELHDVTTLEVDARVRKIAKDLNKSSLLIRIAGGDMVAIGAKYHKRCMTNLTNRHRAFLRKMATSQSNNKDQLNEARAFAELVCFMESCCMDDGKYIFTLSEVHKLYVNRLMDFGIEKSINKTRFKARVLRNFCGELKEQTDGKNTLLVFKEGMASLLKDEVETQDYDSDTLILAKAAKIVRREIFNEESRFNFNGQFPTNCQANSVPSCLKVLVSMLTSGTNIAHENASDSQAMLTISQLIVFNSQKILSRSSKVRHSLKREPPLPLYVSLSIYSQTRSKKIINQLYNLGLSVSYDRVDDLNNGIASSVCSRFQEDGVVCPLNLCHGLFTVGALNNIDHNPSSTTSAGSFHGTGISLFQFPSTLAFGASRPSITLEMDNSKKLFNLPEEYAMVPAAGANTSKLTVSETSYHGSFYGKLKGAISQEECWVQHVSGILDKDLADNDVISWSGYHGSSSDLHIPHPVISGLLPLFEEKSTSLAMIKHGMDVQRRATEFLNPGQIPVAAFDQPLFALAKFVQWNWPLTHGESKHVVMFGGLHIEMALWRVCGDLLEDSGWTSALTESGITTSGKANSFLHTTHLTRTRYAHQITVVALSKLQKQAFLKTESPEHNEDDFQKWKESMKEKSPTFHFWDMVLRIQMMILIFIRSHREMNFSLYVEVLECLVPWFFALDHTNYARWIPIHIRDMKSLPANIKEEIQKYWVIGKTSKPFSCIPIDQAHEQNNDIVKGSGGAVGLTENPVAFRRWMVSGPEFARIVKEFENQYLYDEDPNDGNLSKHHEHGLSAQKAFQSHVQNLSSTTQTWRNPFDEYSEDLVNIATGDCASQEVVESLNNLDLSGQQQYAAYVNKVIEERTVSINEPIKKNSPALFKRQNAKPKTKPQQHVKALRSDCNLFSRLYVDAQHRSGNLEEFFKHENQPYPPSLSEFGNLRLGKKSDLLSIIKPSQQPDGPTSYDCKIIDGAAIVHSLPTSSACTFNNYADNVFIPFLVAQQQSTNRLDVVWDTYKEKSIKGSARNKRGKGTRKKVSGETKLPSNWKDFLQVDAYKKELVATLGESVVSSGRPAIDMGRCDHEEADTRIAVHVLHSLEHGASRLLIRTVDTDVIVILVGLLNDLISLHPSTDIWIAFGMGKHYQYISVNAICSSLSPDTSQALPIFHAFTGCDTTSCFFGKGKKSAWEAWKSYPAVTEAFLHLRNNTFQSLGLEDPELKTLERFTVVIYDRTSNLLSVNEARQELFTKKVRTLENIPPTQDALLQHILRTIYQSSIWTKSLQSIQTVPSPEGWGWTDINNAWIPVWTTIPEAAKVCEELLKCGCQKGCTSRCKCSKANLPCTYLCKCSGECDNNN